MASREHLAPISAFVSDSVASPSDTLKKKKQAIEEPIFSNASDSIVYSIDGQRAYLYGDAIVKYQDLELKAAYIEFDMEKRVVFAEGRPDSTGAIAGKPLFKEGSQEFEMDNIFYNFDSRKAKISGVITEQAGGYLHSSITKKMANDHINVAGGKFTTCDQEHPHFYIAISKAKLIPNDKIIAGPAYIVIEDVTLPIGIPFGFFPSTSSRQSGVILPEYGEEANRGFFLRGGGFYFGLSDYMDMTVTADVFSLGSWAGKARSQYKKRYKYSGSFSFDLASNVIGEKGAANYTKSNTYWLRWNHTQDPKARPNTTFQANVNFGSSSHNKFNSVALQEYLSNSITSSISYSRVWEGTPFSLSTSLNHSQNTRDSIVTIGFPRVSFNMARIYPFKKKNATGPATWYQKIGLSYSTNLDNSVTVKEDVLFTEQVFDKFKSGMKHDIPLSTSFNLLKYITVSPSVNYSEVWYLKTIEKNWDETTKSVVIDTIPGFKRAWQYSTSASMSTKIYGMYNFGPKSPVVAVRHMMTPSVSISYRPDFAKPEYGYFKSVQVDETGKKFQQYSIFEQGVYGGPSAGEAGLIGFSLGNNLEMKVRSRKDSTADFRKIKILESFNVSTSYNLLADSMNLSDISFSGRTNLFDKVSVNFSGAFSPYAISKDGRVYDRYQFKENGSLARFTRGTVGLSFSLKGGDKGNNNDENNPPVDPPLGTNPSDVYMNDAMSTDYTNLNYVDFEVPWSVTFNYNFTYSKPGLEKSINQTLSFSGDLNLTQKLKFAFTSGYDFKNNRLTTTSFNLIRNLHCWEMRLTVIPIGFRKSYSFQINVRPGILQDLKLTKRESYLDRI
ncbi:MAG: putative LPS assembly protein LptD [Tenuifilaceae bacterium]|nr:putative LPS assembly protein LptD [Tenuifilaceae bacterium]